MDPPTTESHLMPIGGQPASKIVVPTDHSQIKEQTQSEELTSSGNWETEMLVLLQEIRAEQKSYLALRREKWNLLVDHNRIAQLLWESDWGSGNTYSREESCNMERPTGKEFLTTIIPSTSNMKKSGALLSCWVKIETEHFFTKDLLSGATVWDDDNYKHLIHGPSNLGNKCWTIYAITTSRSEDPLHFLSLGSRAEVC